MTKTQKTVATVLLTITIILLVGMLMWGIRGFNRWTGWNFNGWSFSGIPGVFTSSRLPEDAQPREEFEASAGDINTIYLDFAHETVEVVVWDKDMVKVEQKSNSQLQDEAKMRAELYNGDFVAQSGLMGRSGFGNIPSSTITLYVPRSLDKKMVVDTASGEASITDGEYAELHVDSASGNIRINNATTADLHTSSTSGNIELMEIQSNSISADTTSGNITVSGDAGRVLDADSTSGNINMAGTAAEVNIDTMSGEVTLDLQSAEEISANTASGTVRVTARDATMLRGIDVETTSGEVQVNLGKNDGFTVDFDSVSGDVRNPDFDMRGEVNGNGKTEINVDTVSGDLAISKI